MPPEVVEPNLKTAFPPAPGPPDVLRGADWDSLPSATRETLCHRVADGREAGAAPGGRRRSGAPPAPDGVLGFPPKNVRVNDPAGDTGAGGSTGQNRPSLSVNGADVVVVFNDPQLLPATAAGFARSDDGGASFVDLGGLPGSQFGNPVLADDGAGNLYFATILRQGGLITSPPPFSSIGVSRSTDGGVSFTPPVNVLDDTAGVERVQDVGWLAADRATGNLYLTWSEVSASVPGGDLDRVQIRFSRSDDHGATWSPPWRSRRRLPTANGGRCRPSPRTVRST